MILAPLLLFCGAGCASSEEDAASRGRFVPLVTLADWREVPRDEDPFVTDLGAAPTCAGPSFSLEEQWLEIDTGRCSWVTLVASPRGSVAKEQALRLTVSHFDLVAPQDAEADVRVAFGDCQVWREVVPIPSPAAVIERELASPCAFGVDSRVYFHLHNHGQNSWQLQDLSVQR